MDTQRKRRIIIDAITIHIDSSCCYDTAMMAVTSFVVEIRELRKVFRFRIPVQLILQMHARRCALHPLAILSQDG